MGRQRQRRSNNKRSGGDPRARRLHIEPLEDRRMLAAVTVTNNLDEVNGDTASIDALIASDGGDGISLREAIEAANMDAVADVIDFDGGLSGETILLTQGELVISSILTINGPGADVLAIDASGNDPTPDENNGDGSRVFLLDDGNDSLILEISIFGVTITGGDVTDEGGGIYSREALAIVESTIRDNFTSGEGFVGGGISNRIGMLTITNSLVSGNGTYGRLADGGGIFSDAQLTVTGSTIRDNATKNDLYQDLFPVSPLVTSGSHDPPGAAASGGGIHANDLSIEFSEITGNSTVGGNSYGGGISVIGNLTIVGSDISNNSTIGDAGRGGGIYWGPNNDKTATITDSNISHNTTWGQVAHGGGFATFNSGDLAVIRSTVNDNTTFGLAAVGGGILARGVLSFTVSNSTISNNIETGDTSTISGGGIHVQSFANPVITTSTIVNNKASTGAGGIQSSSSIELYGTIASGNWTTQNGLALRRSDVSSFETQLGYSLVGVIDGDFIESPGTVNYFDIDPFLGPLTNNGGSTKTHALLAGSPAIDAGDPGIVAPPSYDQRGAPYQRIADGDADGMARIDIGAFEVPTTFVVTTELDEFDGVIDHNLGGAMSLREAITLANLTPQPINITFDASLDGATIFIDQLNLDALPTITDNLSIDASNLASGLTIHAGHGLDGVPETADGIRVFNIDDGDLNRFLNAQLVGLTLTGGDVSASGGAILSQENLTVQSSKIVDNATSGGFYSGGGGIANSGMLTLNDSVISNNYSLRFGGAIYNSNAIFAMNRSIINDNYAQNYGGGISNRNAQSTISESLINGNIAGFWGGGFYNSLSSGLGSSTLIQNSTISNNSAQASEGGAIYEFSGTTILLNSTVFENSSETGGGIFLSSDGVNPALILSNTIVAGSTDTDGQIVPDISASFSITVIANYSLIVSSGLAAIAGSNNVIGLDPLLGPLADNGGPTMTHALLPGSPALDAGNSSGATDQRGIGAPVDLPGIVNAIGGDGSDIGAYEAQVNPSADFDSNLVVNGIDFLFWQRGFGLTAGATLPDGNSDDDGDNDHSDFAAWEVSFGETLPAPLAAQDEVEALPVLAATVDEDLTAPTFALTATDVGLLQENREASRILPQGTPVVQRQPGRLFEEIRDRALLEFESTGEVAAKSMAFEFERPQWKMASAYESTVDEAFKQLADDDLAFDQTLGSA